METINYPKEFNPKIYGFFEIKEKTKRRCILKQVISTKYHSVKQMENMASNLREKFKEYCSIDYSFDVNAHVSNILKISNREKYKIYRVSLGHVHCESWQELIQKYHEMMN